jgi:APA family basic amino acid/polyamine antiporter
MTGVASYESFKGVEVIAPVAVAIDHMGQANPDGTITPDYPWMNKAIILAILGGYASVIMVMLMGQSRVFFSMSRDGLVPKVFSEVHKKYRTPARNNFMFMLLVSVFAAFVPANVVGEMTSIGTLFAFILVCIGVIVMRRTQPDAPRVFKTPLVPLVPILGVATCLFMMVFLPLDTWIRLVAWMMIGFDLYLFYGMKNSHMNRQGFSNKSFRTVAYTGMGMVLILIVVAVLYNQAPEASSGLFWFSIIFALAHVIIYSIGARQKNKITDK